MVKNMTIRLGFAGGIALTVFAGAFPGGAWGVGHPEREVIAMFHPGTITMPAGTDSTSALSEVTESAAILRVFDKFTVELIEKAFPQSVLAERAKIKGCVKS